MSGGPQYENEGDKVVVYPPPPPPPAAGQSSSSSASASSLSDSSQQRYLHHPAAHDTAVIPPASDICEASGKAAKPVWVQGAYPSDPTAATTSSASHSGVPTAPPMSVVVDAEGMGGQILQGSSQGAAAAASSSAPHPGRVSTASHDSNTPLLDAQRAPVEVPPSRGNSNKASTAAASTNPRGGGAGVVQVYASVEAMPPKGEKVSICGLHANYALNGKEGTVVGYRSDGAVLVSIPSQGISCAPIHPDNLQWGGTTDDDLFGPALTAEALQTFMATNNQVSKYDGLTIMKVPPSRRGRATLFGKRMDAPAARGPDECCCRPTPWSDFSLFAVALGLLLNFVLGVLTLVGVMLSIPVAIVPLCFRHAARIWRWLAHRHVDVLLAVAPPEKGVVATHPNASIPNGTNMRYAGSCHTWKCLIYCFIGPPLSFFSLFIAMFGMSLGVLIFCRPLYNLMTNIVWAIASFDRAVACTLLTHTVCEYDLYVQEIERGEQEGAQDADVVIEAQGDNLQGSATQEPHEGVTYDGYVQAGQDVETAVSNPFLRGRGRTMEEGMALDKFNGAFTRLFGRASRLQDITIHPPREPGRGPRHYITLADTLTDAERLKVIKAYKQAFSTMYVHIVDLDEQERQGGTDYSELYS